MNSDREGALRRKMDAEGLRAAHLAGVLRALVDAVDARERLEVAADDARRELDRLCPSSSVTAAQAEDIAYAERCWDGGERDSDDPGALTMGIGDGCRVRVTAAQVEVLGRMSYTRPREVV